MITMNDVKRTIRFKYHIFLTDCCLYFAKKHMRDDDNRRYWYWMDKVITHLKLALNRN